jgi:hypothetical protein
MTTIDTDQPVPPEFEQPVAPEVDGAAPAGFVRRSTSTALGAALGALERLTPEGVGRWRDVAVGAAFEAEETAAGLLADLRRTGAWRRRRIAELAERGAAERARGRERAAGAVEGAATAVASSPLLDRIVVVTSPVVDRIVDAQLERILRPVVLAVLDDVLVLLEKEPDRVQALIRGQRDNMVDELVARIRTGAANGDIAVDRLTSRMFHRGRRQVGRAPATDEL